jgi:hypothetical protein
MMRKDPVKKDFSVIVLVNKRKKEERLIEHFFLFSLSD